MADISQLLEQTTVTEVDKRVATVDNVLSTKTDTDKRKVFSFYDTTQVIKPLSSKPIKNNNTEELNGIPPNSLAALENKVNYEINNDEDLEKAFIDVTADLKGDQRTIGFTESSASQDIAYKVPSVEERKTVSNRVMSKSLMDERLKGRQDNSRIRGSIYSESITTSGDMNLSNSEEYKIDANTVATANVSILAKTSDDVNFYSPSSSTMNDFQGLSMEAVVSLQSSYNDVVKYIETVCTDLNDLFGGLLLDINSVFNSFNLLLNIALSFNCASLLNALINCFDMAADTILNVKNISKVGKGLLTNGSTNLLHTFMENVSKSKVSFSVLLNHTFENNRKNAIENNKPYDEAASKEEFLSLKAEFNVDTDREMKRDMGKTRLHNESMINQTEVYDIHKIQRDDEISRMNMSDEEFESDYLYSIKNQPLSHYTNT